MKHTWLVRVTATSFHEDVTASNRFLVFLVEDLLFEDRQAARTVDRARPLRDTVSPGGRPPDPIRPVDQPGTLRQRIERIACLNDTEV